MSPNTVLYCEISTNMAIQISLLTTQDTKHDASYTPERSFKDASYKKDSHQHIPSGAWC
jgi:hypothetical protein